MKIRLLICFSCMVLLLGCRQLVSNSAKATEKQGYYDRNWQWINAPHKTLPTHEQWAGLQEQYSAIPSDFLAVAERELQEEIAAADCYKYLYNADSSKFLMFFIQDKNHPNYKKLTRFGQTVHLHNRSATADSIEFNAYILWGMKIEENWYYHKTSEHEFWGNDRKEAQLDFVHFILSSNDFFLYYQKNTEGFWYFGGTTAVFRELPKNTTYLQEFAGYPELVGWHEVSKRGREKQILNAEIEKTACEVQGDLWSLMHKFDSATFYARYKSTYSGKSCSALYNSTRDIILLPFIYYDSNSQAWLTYYVLKIKPHGNELFTWLRFPAKKINQEPGKESLQIVFDIRTYIENWNWGTVNMISNTSFWTENFKDFDLEQLEFP